MAGIKKEVIEYRRYDLQVDFPVLLLDGDKWKISDITSHNLHFHNCLEIGMCSSENGTMIFEGQRFDFTAGDITCIPGSVPHTTYSAPGKASQWTYVFVDLPLLLGKLTPGSSETYLLPETDIGNFQYIMSGESHEKARALTCCIMDELRKKQTDYRMSVAGLMLAYYYEIRRNIKTRDKTAKGLGKGYLTIMPALDYIHVNYGEQFYVRHLAEICYMSISHFRMVFLQAIGDTPLDFLNTVRIEKACVLLRTTDKTILTISKQVGFSSYTSFLRYFTRIAGIPPHEYRDALELAGITLKRKSILEYMGWL
jgi:AraC family transcriptional regulator, activator of mtrCDE